MSSDSNDTSNATKEVDTGSGSALNGVPKRSSPVVYHEKQCRQMCAKHALNNLLQSGEAFTKSDLDLICYAYVFDHFLTGLVSD